MALKQSLRDIAAIKQTITRDGHLRIHLKYGRNGGCIARLWHPDGFRVGHATGGGYDLGGAALGEAINLFFAEELKALPLPSSKQGFATSGLYGLSEFDGVRSVDGACGLDCMLAILRALGFAKVVKYETSKSTSLVIADR